MAVSGECIVAYFGSVLTVIVTVRFLLQCVALNKFEPYDTEDSLVNASVKYVESQALLAGV
jgi:hypothetical protein